MLKHNMDLVVVLLDTLEMVVEEQHQMEMVVVQVLVQHLVAQLEVVLEVVA